MIYERQAFIAKNSEISKDALLVPEYVPDFGKKCKCNFFLNYNLEWEVEGFKEDFWAWIHANMEGEVRVFATGNWIGFTSYHDAFEFLLTW